MMSSNPETPPLKPPRRSSSGRKRNGDRPPTDKEVIIVAGGNGVGKTTFALEFILENPRYEFLNADEIAKELSPDDPQGNKMSAGKAFFKRLVEYVRDGKSFLIESTLSGRYLIRVIEILKERNYTVTIMFLYVGSADILIERIRNRVARGGHTYRIKTLKGDLCGEERTSGTIIKI